MTRDLPNVQLSICSPDDRGDALQLLLQAFSPQQATQVIEGLSGLVQAGVKVFAGLAVAHRQQELVGVCWLQPQIGRTATLWPPQFMADLTGDAEREARYGLAELALQGGQQLPVALVQALLESADDPWGKDLESLGFRHLADLGYLEWRVTREGLLPQGDERFSLTPHADKDRQLLKSILAETYQQTLDCPALEGLRDVDDTLAGYQAIGVYDPRLWFLVRWERQPAGVLLLASYPESCQWELVYMGIAPRFRGLGLGRLVLAELQRAALDAELLRVVLAVDAANWPAQQMYEQAGYREWAQRTAYVKPLVSP